VRKVGPDIDALDFTGYTIVGVFTITGWRDQDGKSDDSGTFNGCQFGRVIIFDGNKGLECSGYSYQYAYRLPDSYPFVLTPAVVEKLRFIYDTINAGPPPGA